MDFAHDPRTEELRGALLEFMDQHVYPAEPEFERAGPDAPFSWERPKIMAELQAEARRRGLWNLFLPDPEHGAGLTNVQYAPLAEITGRSPQVAPEALNCAAPDTGNLELLHMFATPEQRANVQIIGNGDVAHWPDVDEDISARGMLAGIPAPRQKRLV